MALTTSDKLSNLKIEQEKQQKEAALYENDLLKSLMISGATGQGGSPGQLYKPPVTNPGRGEAVYGTEKDGQRYFEFLKAMMIDPANNIRRTGKKPLANDDDYGEGEVGSGWKISHGEGRGPQQKFHTEYNEPLDKPPWRSIYPSGETLDIEWQKEEYMKDHPQFFPKNKGMTISGASSRQIRDRLRPFTSGGPADYDKEGGSLRGVPNPLRIQLLRDAKA